MTDPVAASETPATPPSAEADDPELETAEPTAASGPRINEDWAATIVGLALVVLVLAGVIGKGLIP